ncbi:hypothetical protein BDL97_17G022300 [Sphagnum fallax]|nr:hypothetical protein BDL97_17G022300 [Sphagnum fallax]
MVFNICRGNTVDEDDATNEPPSSVEIDPVRKTSREKKATRREKKKKKSSRSSTLLKPFQNPLHNFFHKPSEKNRAAAAGTNPNPSSPNRSPSSSPVLSGPAAAGAARSSSSSKKKKGRHSGRAGARKQFLKATVEGIGNVAIFDNLQSLPDLDTAFDNFKEVYVRYDETEEVDHLRAEEYYHFAERDHVCLDYSGFGLFSQSQQFTEQASSSSFGLAYVSANLLVHTLYGMAAEGTLEFDIQRRIMKYMNISESDYIMVFTTSRSSAYKILAESYPFGAYSRLLTVYDYQSEAMSLMVASAKQRGAKTLTANFKWPSLQISARDLRYKLQDKRHRKEPRRKGLFVFPVQSRVTGAKYSYQWMSQAQANDWNVLLDASALGPKDMDALGLSLFRPEFIVTSFYKVFGADPTGFGCLFIKKSAIQSLQNSNQPRGVGIVRIVPNPENPQHAPTERSRGSKSKIVSEIQEEGEEGEDDSDEFYLDADGVNQVRSFSGPVSELYLQDDQTFVSHKAASSSRKEKEIAGFSDEAVDVNKFAPFRKDMGTRSVGLQEDQIPEVLQEVGEGSRRDTEAAGPADFLEDKRPKFQTDHDAMPYEAGNGKAVKAEYEIGTEEMMELNHAESVNLNPNRIRRDDPDIRILEGRESGQFLQQQKLFGLGPEESSGQFTYDDGEQPVG